MASSINSSYTIDGARGSKSINGNNTITDVYIVVDVTGASNQRVNEALTTVGVPQIGDVHAAFVNLWCSSTSTEPINSSNTQWKVTCVFTVPQTGSQNENTGSTSSFGGTTTSAQTTEYYDTGTSTFKTMVVGTLDRNAFPSPATAPTTVPKQTPLISKLVPAFTLVAQRKETSSPVSTIKTIIGKLNDAAVTINGEIYAIRTLLCTRVSADTEDDGSSYIVSYEFQFRPSWAIDVVAIDPDTGSPYQNLDSIASGSKSYDIYDGADFNSLIL